MASLNRRQVLSAAAGLTGVAVASVLLPPSVRKAVLAGPADGGSLSDVKHVVCLMQENRSFDHYFGTLPGVRGFSDPHPLALSTGRSVWYQPDAVHPDGFMLPLHLDTSTSNAQQIPSTSHAWSVQHESWNAGKMDNWLPAHRRADRENGPFVMGYYTRNDIPFQFALADAFTVCDAYHSSVLGPTWPNRMYWMTGTIDPGGTGGGPIIANVVPKPYRWTTYAERLERAGVSWKVYQQIDNYGCNMLELFQAFHDSRPGQPLYDKGLTRGGAYDFEDDARNDRLPAVSWIIPTSYQSEHPDYMPAAGADFVASKIEAVAANPDVWAKTAFILNYDENDGLFDHVPPPSPPPGTADEFVAGLPIGGGFRVPCVIISPWTVGGLVATERFDHTSVLQFLEKVTGVAEPNISAWRRSTFGDLTSAFRFGHRGSAPPLPPTRAQLQQAQWGATTLPKPPLTANQQRPPTQEPGTRPRIPPAPGRV
ncbi:MAG TPA: alkaline phosphatase family protein [Pseudonocardia sp.]|jgi:phospholipase C